MAVASRWTRANCCRFDIPLGLWFVGELDDIRESLRGGKSQFRALTVPEELLATS
jgi:hypothetical protein